ncbi:DNA methyltransferase [Variovorax sp. PCZ-1]|uniref:class I SAM-dependent DNA methyltransferase n=1 Tax=Variovorax sp. PCZ-1 TaxID=2835533 RepID=UPI001BCE0511|nr:DNA methyltransferase [Variovorax sp. PCZ-1]MBS7809008.1 class I SAM-dependent DNA methyltransferase [Variovorax sp. PCZ-1]
MPLSWSEIRDRAVAFSREYREAQSEKSLSQQFWRDFFQVFGVDAKRVASYEQQVKLAKAGGTFSNGWIDVFWRGKLLIEMKSAGQNLDRAFGQALQYFDNLPERDLPRFILVCDFQQFRLFDLETNQEHRFKLSELSKHIKLFGFIPGYQVQTIAPQDPVNIKAVRRLRDLHDALRKNGYEGHDLRVFLVRILFCLFADDTGIFQPAGRFKELLDQLTDPAEVGRQLTELFEILNTPEDKRQKAHAENYAGFRYINGKLFAERISTPALDHAAREALLEAAALDWSAISPAIFGAMFQDVMSGAERRDIGAHYTSEENILKLIKPLFLDELWAKFHKVKTNRNRLFDFHKSLRLLHFFDPACGCGNFLVITYRELRKLEAEILRTAYADGQQMLDVHQFTTVDVDQFYGIEIEEFPAQIAQVALWLTDHQINRDLSDEFGKYFDRLPLKSTPHIHHGNALQVDWEDVLPASQCSYILGNPPFVGKKEQSASQKADLEPLTRGIKGAGVLDLVCAWYIKAALYMKAAQIPSKNELSPAENMRGLLSNSLQAAFVSTNSITQGEQVGVLWSWLLAQGIEISFAHRTFKWNNEASGKAAVHCVVIGFGYEWGGVKTIYEYANIAGEPIAKLAANISPYLTDTPSVLIGKRGAAICAVPPIVFGSKAVDFGHFTFDEAEASQFIAIEPKAKAFIREFIGSEEFLNSSKRFCLWLKDATPADLRAMPAVLKRVQLVKQAREASIKVPTQESAHTPALFGEDRQPSSDYLLIPKVSSENRDYVPLGFFGAEVIINPSVLVVPNAGLFELGILQSKMHMAWMSAICGRLESRFQYSAQIVYNNFPWPVELLFLDEKEPLAGIKSARSAIESGAQAVLDARAQFPGSSLADLYDPLAMPPALLKAHQKLDAAVDKAYEFSGGKKSYKTDAERVAFLFELYQRLTSLLPTEKAKKSSKKRASPA